MSGARVLGAIALAGVACLTAAAPMHAPQGVPGKPPVTLLYQNFPNPFPSATSPTTCLWFDLQSDASVTLGIYDLRGHLVRTIVPSGQVPARLVAGYYGRGGSVPAGGCDAHFAWDGRGSDGRNVPAGVYLARLGVNGSWQTRKIVFRGP
ncbi:MAG: hypothetical protein HOQ11_17490 [Gemmatimonadaceae bacterium]|nr:hypothetical protein [Gemmatimonadaceae bacterium]NUQ93117.1 hypothetical protein [Gemmatimonadaceae bacterium]NUR19861.1 hypothetical protein [Gemmatimonadaceae bacterium]NUS99199.1 hypothetical protein [Gemmatimonadaceae bacterium]